MPTITRIQNDCLNIDFSYMELQELSKLIKRTCTGCKSPCVESSEQTHYLADCAAKAGTLESE